MRIVLLLTLIIPPSGLAQDAQRVLTPAAPDTLTSAAFDALDDPASFTGTIADRYPDGRLRLLRSVVHGRPAGLWMEWYPTGVVRYLAEWRPGDGDTPGLGEGLWVYFHESGLVRDRTAYRGDRAWGPSEGWHANGRKAYEGAYRDSERVGQWRWWGTDGALDSTRTYPHVETGRAPTPGVPRAAPPDPEAAYASAGRRTVNVVPSPRRLSNAISPPCPAVTMS